MKRLRRGDIERRLNTFEDYYYEHVFAGAGDPDEAEAKEKAYKRQRERLIKYIIDLAFAFGEKP